jgi:hypothetical protein
VAPRRDHRVPDCEGLKDRPRREAWRFCGPAPTRASVLEARQPGQAGSRATTATAIALAGPLAWRPVTRAMPIGLTERRHAWLATSKHQDNQDDDHNENDGSDADIHVLFLFSGNARPCGRPRPDCPAQSGLTRILSVVIRSPVGPEPADRTRAAPAVGPAAPAALQISTSMPCRAARLSRPPCI